MLFITVFILVVVSINAFQLSSYKNKAQCCRLNMNLFSHNQIDLYKKISKAASVSLFTIVLSGSIINVASNNDHSLLPSLVHADVRAQQKKTYFRFAPKFNEGKEFYKNELKNAIDKEDWVVVSKLFEEYVAKVNKQDPSQVTTDTYVNNKFIRPMTLLAGTFAERGSSPKTRLLMEQKDNFENAMNSLEGCVKETKEDGFFGAKIPIPKGDARVKQAKSAWLAGKDAINSYIKIINDGLMLELNTFSSI